MATARSPQGIGIQILGDDRGVQHMLNVLDTAINPVAIAGFLGAVVDPYLRKRAGARFQTEGDDVVGGWAPLATTTHRIREREGYGPEHPINKRTGELEDYITRGDGKIRMDPLIGASVTIPGEPSSSSKLKSKVKVAQSGGTQVGMQPTPPRPVLGMNERDLAFVLLALASHIKKAGGGI